jgi:hypothetical protein
MFIYTHQEVGTIFVCVILLNGMHGAADLQELISCLTVLNDTTIVFLDIVHRPVFI